MQPQLGWQGQVESLSKDCRPLFDSLGRAITVASMNAKIAVVGRMAAVVFEDEFDSNDMKR